jgi:hypothetical protein
MIAGVGDTDDFGRCDHAGAFSSGVAREQSSAAEDRED